MNSLLIIFIVVLLAAVLGLTWYGVVKTIELERTKAIKEHKESCIGYQQCNRRLKEREE